MTIEDELKALPFKPGEAVSVPYDLVWRAIREIERLRSLAGAVTDGPSHAQLKRQQGPQQVTE